jgi:hypothetical protein
MRHFKLNPAAPKDPRAASSDARGALGLLVDAMLDVYVSWREECTAVTAAYEAWRTAEHRDKEPAFDAYLAALDREYLAAASCRRFAEQVAHAQQARIGGHGLPRAAKTPRLGTEASDA